MFCGIRSFSCVHDDGSWDSSPPRPKRASSLRGKGKKNPYAANGLDKFERLLAELEAKKKEVRLRRGNRDEDTVRFRCAGDGDWIPIVVRRPKPPPLPNKERKPPPPQAEVVVESKKKKAAKKRRFYYWNVCCWALVIVVVLVCLIFGRTFAIFGTAVCWYMVPMMKLRSSKKLRKENVKKCIRDV